MDWLIIFLAKYLVIAIVAVAALVFFKTSPKNRKQLGLAFVLAGIVAIILSKIAGAFYYHPRPFTVENIKPLIAHGNDNGFPSEHTVFSMTLATVIYYYSRRWELIAFLLTLGVGVGRVLAHVHSTLDILAGLIIGAIAGSIGYYTARKLAPKIFKSL